jgi:hypothetical protein
MPVISADGRFVAYSSYATNLVAGFVDNNGGMNGDGGDVFLFDRLTGQSVLVSRVAGAAVAGGNGGSGAFSTAGGCLLAISANGRFVAYRSAATDLVPGFVDLNGTTTQSPNRSDLYLFDRQSGSNVLISRSANSAATGGNAGSSDATISADGRYVAFASGATNLIDGFSGSYSSVYVFDSFLGQVALVSHAFGMPTTGASGLSSAPVISANGEYVTYFSEGRNITPGQGTGSGSSRVYLYDRSAGTNVLVSHGNAGPLEPPNGLSEHPVISSDGRFVAYHSTATNLTPGFIDQNGSDFLSGRDIFVYDRQSGVNTLVTRSVSVPNAGSKQDSDYPTISGDGRFVGYYSNAVDLVSGFVGFAGNHGTFDAIPTNAYVFDRRNGLATLLSGKGGSRTHGGNGDCYTPLLNADGSVVLFGSSADDLVAGDYNGHSDIFAYVTPPPRIQSIRIADGSPQRSVVRSLTVTFDQPVFFAGEPAAAFELSRNGTVVSGQWSVVSQPNPSMVTITLVGSIQQFGSLIDGRYTLRVLASQITNIGPLDGNNDGIGGDDFTFGFHRLFGDADGNGSVDALDFRAFRLAFGTDSFVFDFDGDGDVDAADFVAFRGRFGCGT